MRGHTQAIFSGCRRPPSAVRARTAAASAPRPAGRHRSCPASWTATGYTPNEVIPCALTWNEAVQSTVAPRFLRWRRRTGSRPSPDWCCRPGRGRSPWRRGWTKWVGEVASCTSRPACVWLVPVGDRSLSRVTVAPGRGELRAHRGDGQRQRRPVPAWCVLAWWGLASAGLASASPSSRWPRRRAAAVGTESAA